MVPPFPVVILVRNIILEAVLMVNLYSLLYCEKFDKRCQWLRCSPPPLSFRHCLGEILYTFLNALEK